MSDQRKSARPRLDEAVVERGLAETRARAQAIIMGGGVTVDGTVVTKPGARIIPEATVDLRIQPLPYVSRGGLKLAHALDEFQVDVHGMVALDIGASTGGFTDVLLKGGASKVYAIDVGYGQLAWELRNDARVTVMERTNIRNVGDLPEIADIAVIDVSFISLRQVLPHVQPLLKPVAAAVVLIKPQFEAGRGKVGKKGVVRESRIWEEVLGSVLTYAVAEGWTVAGLSKSPITGPAGNVEFLAHLARGGSEQPIVLNGAVQRVIQQALSP